MRPTSTTTKRALNTRLVNIWREERFVALVIPADVLREVEHGIAHSGAVDEFCRESIAGQFIVMLHPLDCYAIWRWAEMTIVRQESRTFVDPPEGFIEFREWTLASHANQFGQWRNTVPPMRRGLFQRLVPRVTLVN